MNERELLALAGEALAAGKNAREVDAAIRARSGGRFTSYSGLALFVRQTGGGPSTRRRSGGTDPSAPRDPRYEPRNGAEMEAAHARDEAEDAAALARTNARAGNEYTDFARMAAQGITWRLSDEIRGVGAALVPGGKGYREARDAERQALADMRRLDPGASFAAELAGGLLAPLPGASTAGGAAARTTGAAMRGGVRAGIRVGAKPGAIAGGLLAFGGAEGTPVEQLVETAKGTAGGAFVGSVLGAGGAVLGRGGRAARGPRAMDEIAGEFADRAGIPDGEIGSAVEAARQTTRAVSRNAYGPLEAINSIDDPEVLAVLRTPRVLVAAKKVMGKEVATRPPSYVELQQIERTLRRSDNKAGLETLRDVMTRRIAGHAEATAQYRAAKAAENGFKFGERWANKAPDRVAAELRKMPDDVSRENARLAMAANFFDKLSTKGGKITQRDVERLTSLGMRNRIRMMFKNAADADAFLEQVRRSGTAIADRRKLISTAKFLAGVGTLGAAIGAGGALTFSLLD